MLLIVVTPAALSMLTTVAPLLETLKVSIPVESTRTFAPLRTALTVSVPPPPTRLSNVEREFEAEASKVSSPSRPVRVSALL